MGVLLKSPESMATAANMPGMLEVRKARACRKAKKTSKDEASKL